MARGKGKGRENEIPMAAGACCCVSITITLIVLIAKSFGTVDDTEVCLRYNKNTRVVEDEPYLTPGSYFITVTDGFLCYPKNIIQLEFSGTDETHARLTARSIEGLQIGLDLTIDYRLNPAELRQLFTKVGTDFEPIFIRLARSELRNAAANFKATQYLDSSRGSIAILMRDSLNKAFSAHHAEAIDVQIKKDYLPAAFNEQISAVNAAVIRADTALRQRRNDITEETNKNITSVLTAEAERTNILLDEKTEVEGFILNQEAVLVTETTRAENDMLAAETARENVLLTAAAEVEKASSARNGAITAAGAEREREIITFATEIIEVEAEGDKVAIAANASALAIKVEQDARVTTYVEEKKIEREILVKIRNATTDMDSQRLLQYQWFGALRDQTSALFTLDYHKVPFFLESGKDIPS